MTCDFYSGGLGRIVRLVLILGLPSLPGHAAPPAEHAAAEMALNEGRVDDAIAMLTTTVSANPRDGAAHLLLCRAWYSEEVSDQAVTECEATLANGGAGNAAALDWMGRAYGQKASHALLGALSLAKRVRAEFEAAVAADPTNVDAANDLSEFYMSAPSLVGGSVDKALALADRVQATMPQAAHRMRGLAAAERGDYGTAENEFKAAVGVAGRPNAWVDLAAFYQRRKRYDDAVSTLDRAKRADSARDASLVDMSSILLDMKRNLPEAIQLLRVYVASPNKSDAGPLCRAHLLAGKMLAKSGDSNGARQEYEAALKLASKYEAAQKALISL